MSGQCKTAAARDGRTHTHSAGFALHIAQQLGERFLNAGKMAAVVAEQNTPCPVEQNDFYGRRTDVDAQFIINIGLILLLHC